MEGTRGSGSRDEITSGEERVKNLKKMFRRNHKCVERLLMVNSTERETSVGETRAFVIVENVNDNVKRGIPYPDQR